jgi:uncharacterized membrane protein
LDITRLALLAHVIAAFMFMAGYVGTNLLTEIARRAATPGDRRSAIALSNRFDRTLLMPGGNAVLVTGLIALWVFGYSIATPWIVASTLLFLALPALGALYWARLGRQVDEALARDDDDTAATLLRNPRAVAISRFENIVVLTIVALMVLRPG